VLLLRVSEITLAYLEAESCFPYLASARRVRVACDATDKNIGLRKFHMWRESVIFREGWVIVATLGTAFRNALQHPSCFISLRLFLKMHRREATFETLLMLQWFLMGINYIWENAYNDGLWSRDTHYVIYISNSKFCSNFSSLTG